MFVTRFKFNCMLVALAALITMTFAVMTGKAMAITAPRTETLKVAFLEVRDARGNLVRVEPNFPWAHMAVSIDGGWLHAHPATGVEWVSGTNLEKYGRIAHVISVPKWFKPRLDLVDGFIGQPYDHGFSWNNQALYCSELVAKTLGIAPVPMVFDPQLWPRSYLRFNGLPGISPGLVYRRLIQE